MPVFGNKDVLLGVGVFADVKPITLVLCGAVRNLRGLLHTASSLARKNVRWRMYSARNVAGKIIGVSRPDTSVAKQIANDVSSREMSHLCRAL